MPPTLETVAPVVVTPVAQPAVVGAVGDEPPEFTVQEPHVAKAPSQNASADPVAAFTDESIGQHEFDDLTPVSGTEVIAAETGAQAEPHVMTSVVNEVEEAKEVAEFVEIPTPAAELVALIEETPGQEASVDVCGSASKPEALDAAAPQLEALDDAASQPVAAELQEAPYVEVVAVESEYAADQVPELAAEETQLHVQDTIVQTAEEPLVEALSSPEVEADVSAGTESASHQAEDMAPAEAEAQPASESFLHEDRIVETQDTDTPTPVPEHAGLVDETPSSNIATDAHEPVEAAPAITPEFEEVETKTQDPVVEAVVEAPVVDFPVAEEAQPSLEVELPTQTRDIQAAEALSTGSNLEATTAALATVDEVIPDTAETTSTPDAPTEDAEGHTPAPESVPIEDTLEVANQASEPADPEPIEDKAAEPIAEEAQDLVKDAAPIASESVTITPIVTIEESVAQDVLAPIDQPSSEPAPQFVDETVDPPIVAVPVPDEISAVEVEVQVESQMVPPTVDTVDEPLIEDAELAPEGDVLVQETRVVVDASKPETLAAEPELVEASASASVVEDAPVPVEAEETFPVLVEESEEDDAASQPEGKC
ncbi:hypothetical protein OG21DRAFT_592058 [Imleria badia]|nr:hypothetical protein OG21DRAFT_592058 [Imleria badia]